MMSLGVPMILMGDEVRHTQGGNNNAYCQDNEISWFDWTKVAKHADVHRFVKLLIQRRLLRDMEHERQRLSPDEKMSRTRSQQGLARRQTLPARLGRWISHSLVLGAELKAEGMHFHFILNAYWEPLEYELPKLNGGASWRRWIDTGLEAPNDIGSWRTGPSVAGQTYRAEARSVVLLFAGGKE